MNTLLIGSGLSLLACIIITPILIPLLTRLKFGQSIREEGPAWHQKKSGTPTMGGLAIICAVVFGSLAAYFISGNFGVTEISLVVGSLLFGIIGFVDGFGASLGITLLGVSVLGYVGYVFLLPYMDLSYSLYYRQLTAVPASGAGDEWTPEL